MFKLLRRMRRDERGQAMVLGAVAMLILAVTVMTSVSIGHGVYEKIKLQDATDAQAYSTAVKQARTYNFLAYTNRAMIVHYAAMLTVMSYVSHAVYLDQTIRVAASYLKVIPGIGAIFAAVEQVIKIWKTVVETVSQILVPLLTALNIALWLAQEAMVFNTFLDSFYSAIEPDAVVSNTDKHAKVGFVMGGGGGGSWEAWAANGGLSLSNGKNFLHVLDDGPHSSGSLDYSDPTGLGKRSKLMKNSNKLSDPDMAKYRLLMGNLANGVRREWTAVGKGPMIIGRKWSFNLCVIIGQLRINKVADSQIKSFDENFEDNRKDELFASDDIKVEVRPLCFGIFSKWKTVFELRFRAAADAQDGYHQEYGRRKSDKHHNWMGITPFVHSDTSFVKPWLYHFSYPCSLVVLSKDVMAKGEDAPPKKPVFQLSNLSKDGNSTGRGFMDENGSGQFNDPDEGIQEGFLDMTWDHVGGNNVDGDYFREKTGGMMAMTVGRAIYHRPGDWKEEPNFFNPLWTARLAPLKTHWEEKYMKTLILEWPIIEEEFGKDAINY